MPQQKHNSEQLRAYREVAAELRELSLGVKEHIDQAGQTGELQQAKATLSELQLRTEEFRTLREALGSTCIFLAKYNVVVLNEHTVSFVLPRGVSRIEVLQEARGVVQDQELIYPNQLHRWMEDPKFTKKVERSEPICICGHVKGSADKDRAEQESIVGKENVPLLEDLAVAFAINWIATGEPLFGWYNKSNEWCHEVRAVGGALDFSLYHGLGLSVIRDSNHRVDVVVAAFGSR